MAKFDADIQRGLKAHALSVKHEAALSKRTPAGHSAYLAAKLSELGASIPNQIAARAGTGQSSGAQKQEFEKLVLLLSAIRENVKQDDDATAADKKAYGLGVRLDTRSPKKVLGAAQSVLNAARAKPDRAQVLGILPDDLTQLGALTHAAAEADTSEDSVRAAAPLTTKRRNALLAEVSAAVKKIAGAGILEFAMNATVRSEFEALLDGPKRAAPPVP